MNSEVGLILTLHGLLGIELLTLNGVWAGALLVGVYVGSIAVVAVLLVQLPTTYFLDSIRAGASTRSSAGPPSS